MKKKILTVLFSLLCLEAGMIMGGLVCSLLYLCYVPLDYFIKYADWTLNGVVVSLNFAFIPSHGLILLFSLVIPGIGWKFSELKPLLCFIYSLFFSIVFFCITYVVMLRHIWCVIRANKGSIWGLDDVVAMVLPFVIYFAVKFVVTPVVRQLSGNNPVEIGGYMSIVRVFGKIVAIYVAFSTLCIYVFQNSEWPQKLWGMSFKQSLTVLDTIMFAAFSVFVLALMSNYRKVTGKDIGKAVLYWNIFTIAFGSLIIAYWVLVLLTGI